MPAITPMEVQAMVPAGVTPANTISLSTLIEYIIQRTYHDLSVLAELLPRKTDMERKIEIVQFANRTRQLFVRLLALVKWANSASKVDKCSVISSFLDQQAMLFVETADMLAKMARETLVNARLPAFSVPCAIDVLTKGTYTRLPSCIKEKIVPPDPITSQEKEQTLARLNQIIEHRVVTGDLPSHLHRPRIENGRVRFCVEHEFQVTLTLMGDGPNIPWRLLDIEILVEDSDTGDGKALVHPLQINYIHQLVQSRLMDNDKPLHDLYNCLHSFCQSLQLEVLHSQAKRLILQRLGEHIRIEEYIPGHSLLLSYWRDPSRREGKAHHTVHKLSIHIDENDPNNPLVVSHIPMIQGSESIKVEQAIRSDHLSLDKLLMHTIQVRCLAKLTDLEREFRVLAPGPCEIRNVPTVLYVPILYPCLPNERLCIAVDLVKGNFMVSLDEHFLSSKTANMHTADIENSINNDRQELRKLLARMRLWLGLQRCRESIQHISVPCTDFLPFVQHETHPVQHLSRNRLYLKMARQPDYYVVMEAVEAKKRTIEYNYYLLHVTPISLDVEGNKKVTDTNTQVELPVVYLKPGHFIKLDTFALTHSATSKLYDVVEEEANPLIRKRKLLMGDPYELPHKRPRASPYFLPELLHIMAHCEERIPFIMLAEELEKRGLHHQGIEVEGDGTGMCLMLLKMLPCGDISKSAQQSLNNNLLSTKFRIQQHAGRICIVEAIFTNCPVKSTSYRETGPIHRVHFFHDLSSADMMPKLVQSLIDDWTSLAHLYQAVLDFAYTYQNDSKFQSNIEIKSYSYKRLILAYGPNKCFSVTIQYQAKESQFHLSFGTCGASAVANCHTIVSTHLIQTLNNHHSIVQLAEILIDTWSPFSSIGKLTTAPVLGLMTSKLNHPCTHFMVMPQSPTHLRIVFRNVYCIDLRCLGNGVVAIRDGAYSVLDTSKVVEILTPIAGLKAFLNMYVDDSMMSTATKRRSTTEDDHPPSPEMDPLDFISQQHMAGSPAGTRAPRAQQTDGFRFPGPMTPPSNPQTPASPSTQRLTQPYPSASPAGSSFPLASPPSLQHVVTPSPSTVMAPSPSNPTLHVPSPTSFVPAPSPQSLGITMPSPVGQFMNPQVSQPAAVVNPPSRLLPHRSWAASVPTFLSHKALEELVTPSLPSGMKQEHGVNTVMYCPLERFLCCVFLRRHAQRLVAAGTDHIQSLTSEPGIVAFKNETLQFKVSLNMTTLQSIHIKVTPVTEYSSQWEPEELQLVEKFFDLKISTPPYKIHSLTAFVRLLSLPMRVLKDCIQIMRLELMPERNLKWSLHWCLTIPQGAPQLAPIGTVAVVYKNKFLFMVQLSRLGPPTSANEPASFIVPIVYDLNTNKTQAPQLSPTQLDAVQNQALIAINNSFKRFTEFNQKPNDCSLYPAVRELLSSLTVAM